MWRFDAYMALIARVDHGFEYAGGQQGALDRVGGLTRQKHLFHIQAEITKMRMRLLAQKDLAGLYLITDLSRIGELVQRPRLVGAHERGGAKAIQIFDQKDGRRGENFFQRAGRFALNLRKGRLRQWP